MESAVQQFWVGLRLRKINKSKLNDISAILQSLALIWSE